MTGVDGLRHGEARRDAAARRRFPRPAAGGVALVRVRWFAAASAVALAGCAHRIDSVEQRLVLPASAPRYDMAAHQAFAYPVPQGNAAPAFPPHFDARELPPTTICVSFTVDVEGRVRAAAAFAQPGCDAPERLQALRDASLSAVAGWRFAPAMFCDYPDAATRDRDWNGTGCAGARVQARTVPVTLAYAFTFEVRNGKRSVGAARR